MKIPKEALIKINNNKCELVCSPKWLIKIWDEKDFKIRAKGAFYSPAFRSRRWDGMVRAITEGGQFDTGYLPKVIAYLKLNKFNIEYEDFREPFEIDNVPKKLGNAILREHQSQALDIICNHQIDNLSFPRGIIGAATNYGKTILAAGIHKMYNRKTVFLIKEKDLFDQAIQEIPLLLPGQVGIISSKKIEWNNFMICMVPTMYSRIKLIANRLAEYEVCLVDECDLATSKTYTTVLKTLYNAFVKLGLSGSPFVHKDKVKNEQLRKIFGDLIYTMKNKELIEKGFSTPVKCRILKGNETVKCTGEYALEYELGIIKNKERNRRAVRRAKYHHKFGRFPMLIFTQRHKHTSILFKKIKKLGYNVEWVHHERKERKQIVEDFRDGKIDILVTSMILKRGMNFPLLKYILNAGGGDSMGNLLQIIGRGTRTHESKKKTVLEDFFDEGAYLKRHSKHRVALLKSEGFEVVEAYK
jgi:superfamily II DNA or RNA helicase